MIIQRHAVMAVYLSAVAVLATVAGIVQELIRR